MDENALHDYRRAALRTVERIGADIASDGSLGAGCQDLACFYKLPYLMQLAGRAQQAHRLLDYIRVRFLRADGDLRTSDESKTADPILALYPGYINGWVAMAAHKIGRFDLSFPAWNQLRGFWNPDLGGFAIDPGPGAADANIEVLMCAHLGLVALYLGDLGLATGAGRALQNFLSLQPAPQQRLFLRMTGDAKLQTEFPAEAAALHVVEVDQHAQAWFFVGYPMAFLARLVRATGEQQHLDTARGYFDFAARCAPRMVGEHFAHKVAWGAAELASLTGDDAHWRLAAEISGRLIAAQDPDGLWLADQPAHTRMDQSAEVAIWLLEIAALG